MSNSPAKAQAKKKILFLKSQGATKEEAISIVMGDQQREIDRLNRYVVEAVSAMDQDEADRFFGVG